MKTVNIYYDKFLLWYTALRTNQLRWYAGLFGFFTFLDFVYRPIFMGLAAFECIVLWEIGKELYHRYRE